MTKKRDLPPAIAQNSVLRSLLWWFVVVLIALLPLTSVVLAWRMVLPLSDCGQPANATRSGSAGQLCFPLLRPLYGHGTIATDADGNLWFTEQNKIARVTPSGVLTEFSVEFPAGPIIAGPNHSVWFTEMAARGGYKLVRMSSRGESEVLASGLDVSQALNLGPDGNFWIGEPRSITRVSPTGEVTISLPSPNDVVPGADYPGDTCHYCRSRWQSLVFCCCRQDWARDTERRGHIVSSLATDTGWRTGSRTRWSYLFP
jgi:hypothetical protein